MILVSTMRGTLADGSALDVRSEVHFAMADGLIVGVEAHLDADAMADHRAALEAGGFEVPDGLRAQHD